MLNISLEEVKKYQPSYTAVPVYKEVFADTLTPIGFLSNVKKSSNNYFLLESLEGGEKWGRYSFIGFDPVLRIKAKDHKVEVKHTAAVEFEKTDPLATIRTILAEYKVPHMEGIPSLTGGFVGYFSYDFVQYCEPSLHLDPAKATQLPDFDLMLFDKIIAFDHLKQKVFIIVNVKTDNIEVNYHKAEREIASIEALLGQPVAVPKFAPCHMGTMTSNQSRGTYDKNVNRIKEYIRQGDVFQTVYAQKFSAVYEEDLFNLYRVLRTTNPSQYMVMLKNDDVEIAGSSPETLIKVEGTKLTSMPIAGTRKRGRTEAEDQALATELLADDKEQAEHNMLVDLARNDLGKVSEFGSVKVLDYRQIKRFSHVMHITTRVEGTLRKDKDIIDTLCAVFPAGTLSGAPKVRACQIIDELEPERRGIYGGGMGYLDFAGNMDICIGIRTAYKYKDKVYVQAGGGIVADSVLDNEFQETLNKAGALRDALQATVEVER